MLQASVRPVLTRIVLPALLLLAPVVAAEPITCIQNSFGPDCVPPDRPPTDVASTYDAATQVLTLTWSPASGTTPDSYIVYRDGTEWATPTTPTVDDDLTGFDGWHVYEVVAVYGANTGDASLPYGFAKHGTCVGTSTGFPFVVVHPDECP